MKIALIGYGRMGKATALAACAGNHEVVSIVDPVIEQSALQNVECFRNIDEKALASADVCIEFTNPAVAPENFRRVLEFNKPLVTGTTGWFEQIEDIQKQVENCNGSFLYAPNFSIGVNLFYQLAEIAGALFSRFEDYDPYILESHHSGKADSPSGTALRLADIVMECMPQKKRL